MSSNSNDAGSGAIASLWSKLENICLDIAAVSIVLIALYVTLGIALRTFFGASMPDETVLVAEVMIFVTMLPLARVAAEGGFIAVDVFVSFMTKEPRVDALLRLLASLIGLCAVLVILYAAYGSLVDAIVNRNYFFGILSLPEWPGRLAFFISFVLFALRLCALIWTSARTALRP
ncbi:TRAP transporter small permease [Pseudooceanicola sp.]|uniref:TRAP transporter small permease n=1 Tax=Pseudooceanicola sp. TaxID=1914328 RepID=UPI00260668C7|nr:TRAP transporter small permease [Pseudooceanicola sp.]MDF1856815.1 TRAP transporter small permease [Pseudooceanicola sp.]